MSSLKILDLNQDKYQIVDLSFESTKQIVGGLSKVELRDRLNAAETDEEREHLMTLYRENLDLRPQNKSSSGGYWRSGR
jgi:hypothetical protein